MRKRIQAAIDDGARGIAMTVRNRNRLGIVSIALALAPLVPDERNQSTIDVRRGLMQGLSTGAGPAHWRGRMLRDTAGLAGTRIKAIMTDIAATK